MTGQGGVASMGDRSQYDEALHWVDASDYQWQEHGSKGSLREAAVAQVHATLALVDELRALNSGRDQFHREVLEVLTQAKDGDGSLRSEQPAAAPGCQVCGKPGAVTRCIVGPLTREQWLSHRAWLYQLARENGKRGSAAQSYAADTMREYFGPPPEES